MGSRIIFLGTAGDSIVMGKQSRASGGVYIEYEGLSMLINPGPGSVVRAKQYQLSMREIDVLLISENTLLFANDANAVIDAMTNGGLDPRGVVVCAPSVMEESQRYYPAISKFHQSVVERIIKLQHGDRVALNAVEIKPMETHEHLGIGFKITTPSFSIGYVGQSGFTKQVANQYVGCDILILQVPLFSKKSSTQLNIESATEFIAAAKPKLAVITGFGIKMVESDLLAQVREIQKQTKIQTIVAKEGLSIDPKSYSANQRQKKLIT